MTQYKINENLYICECGKEFSKSQSLNAHFSHCKIHKQINNKPLKRTYKSAGSFANMSKDKLKEICKKSNLSRKENIKNGKTKATWKGKHLPDSMKENIRKGRVKYLKEHPGQHGAWDKTKKTYLEEWFETFILQNKLNEKHEIKYNYHVYPYFLDFAFVDIKLDVEVDGSFHYKYANNVNHDKIRNNFLEEAGWRVYRISIDEVNSNPDKVKTDFLHYLLLFDKNTKSRYYTVVLE